MINLGRTMRLGVICVSVLPFVGGCALSSEYVELDQWCWRIAEGHGDEHPPFSRADYFSLVARTAASGNVDMGSAAMGHLSTCSSYVNGNERYVRLLDAYIDAGRTGELRSALRQAHAQAEAGSPLRRRALQVLIDLRMHEYLWDHPKIGAALGYTQFTDGRRRGWNGTGGAWMAEDLAERIIAEGDREFEAIWAEYLDVLSTLRRNADG